MAAGIQERKRFFRILSVLSALCALLAAGVATVPALQADKPISQYVHHVWQNDQGLPQNSVFGIAQTTDGYLWFATQEGLARFDGIKFTVFDNQNTDIKENNIQALCSSRRGGLWFGTEGSGLFFLKDGKLTSYSSKDGLPNDTVEAIVEDHTGGIWVGTLAGLTRLTNGKFTNFSTRNGLSNDTVISVYEDSRGTLWIGTDGGGLNALKDGKLTLYTVKDGLPDNVVRSLLEDREGGLWIATHDGLSRFKDGKFTNYSTKQGLSNNSILSLCQDRDGNLWVGTDGGLNRYRNGSFSVYRKADGLSDDSVPSIFEDVEGDLWVGTYSGGLNRLKDGRFTDYSTETGLSDDESRSILEDREGNVWIATANGLNRYSAGGGAYRTRGASDWVQSGPFQTYFHRDGLASDSVLSLYEDNEAALWVGTRQGLNRFKDGRFATFTTKDGLSDDTVLSIIGDRTGALWIGTASGLNRMTNGRFESYSVKDGLTDDSVSVLLEDRDGAIWIGTDGGGVDCWRDGKFTSLKTSDGLAANVVFSFYQDAGGDIWIGTSGGLSRLRNGKLATISRKDGLFDNTIFQILEDRAGSLWMSCNRGVFNVSKAQLNRFADKQIDRVSSDAYGTADGMKSHECNGGFQPAGCKTSDGRLWFPTTKGVAVIDPDNLKLNELPPPVIVERVMADGKPVDPRAGIHFQPGTGKFEFHFTALSFLAPEKVKFKYKLEGFDTGWIDAGDLREASYTNLRPRSYTFRVKACNNDGVWNEEGASFNFTLNPHVYQTVWFYCLMGVCVLLIGLAAYRFRVRQIRKQFSAVLVERSRLAREIHDTLAQGFVAIGLQLSAATDKLKESPESAEQHLELAQKLIQSSLVEARRSVWDLRPQALEGGNLAGALSDTANRMITGSPIKLNFRVSGTPRVLPAQVESNLLRIGQEALTNAVKHAASSTIALELSFNSGLVGIRVSDDGRGFNPDAAPAASAGHFGLVGIKERVEQLGGRLRLKSSPGHGTEIEVQVPV